MAPIHACTSRDQVSDDDVLLEADQLIAGTAHCGIREYSSRLLERRRGNKRLRREAGLGNTEQQWFRTCRRTTLAQDLRVGLAEHTTIDVLALQELALTRIGDAHLLQHLAHDRADVLVVDLHALQAVDLLHFVEQILLHSARPLNAQNVVRVDGPLGEAVTGAHLVAFMDAQVFADRNFVYALRSGCWDHDDLTLTALDLAEANRAIDFRDDRRVFRPACFEQLGHARQTARDVAGLVDLAADLGECSAWLDVLLVTHGQLSAHRHDELAQFLLTLAVPDLDHRVQPLVAVFDDHELTTTG